MAIKPFLEDPGVIEISGGDNEPGVKVGITYKHPTANPLELDPQDTGTPTISGSGTLAEPIVLDTAGQKVTITITNADNYTSIEWFNYDASIGAGAELSAAEGSKPAGAVLTITYNAGSFTATGLYSLTVVGINLANSSPVETNEEPLWILIE